MEVHEVHLTTPPDHSIYLGPQDEHYSSPVSGSVEVILPFACIDSTGYPKLSVSFTRTVAAAQPCAATASRRSDFLKTLRRPRTTTQVTPDCEQSAASSTETITRCDLWHTQCLVERDEDRGTTKLKFDFGIPVPFDISPTAETVLGSVSYGITAISTFSTTGTTATTTRPIRISRRAIPGHTRTIQHRRTFREHQVCIFLELTPQEGPGSGNKASYAARLRATPTITAGTRPTQLRHVVIKDVNWRVEETVTLVLSKSQSSNSSSDHHVYHKEQSLRQLCRGTMTGRWSATRGYPKTDTTDDMIQIPFDVSIPTRTAATAPVLETSATETSQPCLRPRPCQCSSHTHHAITTTTNTNSDSNAMAMAMLTTDYQLKLDIMAGEDVIDQETGKLVDRKPLWKLFGAFFPLPVYDFLSSHEMPHTQSTAFSANDLPPTYQAAPTPPDYC